MLYFYYLAYNQFLTEFNLNLSNISKYQPLIPLKANISLLLFVFYTILSPATRTIILIS